MKTPQQGDYIDIHTHGSKHLPGIFAIENLMAHESVLPDLNTGTEFSFGIHPWFLNESNYDQQIALVREAALHVSVAAIGEAGFDKIKGPSPELQHKAFGEQVMIAEYVKKPVFIHCVKAWDWLIPEHKSLRPGMPWMIHGFRGNKVLAAQLLSRGMYLSFWFDFILRPESSDLIRSLPADRIFLETDGSDADIREIYFKVSEDLGINVDNLKARILLNFNDFFRLKY
jgi:TatD DNase family protein